VKIGTSAIFSSYQLTNQVANIGESFLQRKSVSETGKREDICCIGYLMTELMDPETYSRNNRTIELQNRGSWSSGILDFHSCTQAKSLKELKLVRTTLTIVNLC
jgi:hypothetical protein